jgi:hypothetical protein
MNLLDTVLGSFRNYSKKIKREILWDVWSYSTKTQTEECITALFIGGSEIEKNYFCHLIFDENFDATYLGRIWFWELFFCFYKLKDKYDMVAVHSITQICNIFNSNGNFVIPSWVCCEMDLCCDVGQSCISKRTLKSNLKKIEQGIFCYSVTKNLKKFDHFYYCMYLPYVSSRHGDTAYTFSYAEMKRSFLNGELLLIIYKEKAVAGIIIDYKRMKNMPRFTILGVLNGDISYLKKGAIIALYYYAMQYLKKEGHKKVSLGTTRPFFSDGVLHFKLNWGAKIVYGSSHSFLLSLPTPKHYFCNILSQNPFIYFERNNLCLAKFSSYNTNECQYLPRDEEKIKLYGLDKISIFPY